MLWHGPWGGVIAPTLLLPPLQGVMVTVHVRNEASCQPGLLLLLRGWGGFVPKITLRSPCVLCS